MSKYLIICDEASLLLKKFAQTAKGNVDMDL